MYDTHNTTEQQTAGDNETDMASAPTQAEERTELTFDGLIARLKEILEEDEDSADIDAIKEAMASYVIFALPICNIGTPETHSMRTENSRPGCVCIVDCRYKSCDADWEKYAHWDDHK